MLVTLIYPIKFVPLRHDKEHRRDTSLSASSTGERLAYIPHLDRRDGGKHPCGTGICKARCYGSRPAAATLLVMWRNEAVKAGIPEITKVANMFYGHIHGVINAMALNHAAFLPIFSVSPCLCVLKIGC